MTVEGKKYRKKPVVIEAIKWDGSNVMELLDWAEKHGVWGDDFKIEQDKVVILTPEGYITASKGDYIIKGVQDEFYPCKPDIFAATYEAVEEGSDNEE